MIQSISNISKWNTTSFAHVACCNYNNGILFPEGNISLASNASSAELAANTPTGKYEIRQSYRNAGTKNNNGTLPSHVGIYVHNSQIIIVIYIFGLFKLIFVITKLPGKSKFMWMLLHSPIWSSQLCFAINYTQCFVSSTSTSLEKRFIFYRYVITCSCIGNSTSANLLYWILCLCNG